MTNSVKTKNPARVATTAPAQLNVDSFSCDSHFIYRGDSRLDATAYSAEASRALAAIDAIPGFHSPLGQLCGTIWHPVQNQARSNFKRIYVDKKHGVPFVGSREMFFLPLRPERSLSLRIPKLSDLMVPEGWLLITRSGTVGNVLYVYNRLSKCAITDHAIRIQPTRAPAGFLYAFLAGRFGKPLITQGMYGSTVDELEPKHIASIPVPLFDQPTRDEVHTKIVQAYRLRDQANELLDEAELELYDKMGVDPFDECDIEYFGDPAKLKAFEIDASELGERFDATCHIPTARSAVDKLAKGKHKLVPLVERVRSIYLAPRFARVYVDAEHGTPLLQGSHVLMMRIHALKYISNSQTERIERWLIRAGTVLITCSGTIGRVAVATKRMDGWAASQHILRVNAEPGVTHPGFLAAFLMTGFGQHQLKARIYGGVVDELTDIDTASCVIPDVGFTDQETIGAKVCRAFELRDVANDLEDAAVGEVEGLISEHAN
jgi:type I restriction enzyme, S subunit